MKALRILGRILLFLLLAGCFMLATMIYEGYKMRSSIREANDDISIWQRERDQIYAAEQAGFTGSVMEQRSKSERPSIDTVILKLNSSTSPDISYTLNYFLQRRDNNTLRLLFDISAVREIDIGDKISKEPFSLDFSVYDARGRFKKKWWMLYFSAESPDTVVQKGNLIFGLYGGNADTLFSGTVDSSGKRNGNWRYYTSYPANYKMFEGQYRNDKRNGLFRKYYELTNQLTYEENYTDNLPDGSFTWWYSNGQLESKKYFAKGTPVGVWKFYDKKGKLIRTENHKGN
jgi:hypothetical protein